MVTSFMIVLLLSYAFGQQMHGSNCPTKCTCTDSEVTCHDLTSYPSSFSPDTRKILIESSHLKEIPRSALQELPDLLSFEISSSKIGSINSQAFVDLSVENLTIVNCTIFTIKSKAFEKCHEIDSFLIKDTRIHRIEEYAFSDMNDFGRFNMESSFLGTVQTHAFFNINYFEHMELIGLRISLIEQSAFDTFSLGGKCNLSYNRIDDLHLDSFSNFLNGETPTNLTVSHNEVKHLQGQSVSFPFENATHVGIFENIIPCHWGRQNVKPFAQIHLRSNYCQDNNTGNTYSLYNIINSSFPFNDIEKYQNNDTYVHRSNNITVITNIDNASTDARESTSGIGGTELNKVYRNAIKGDASVLRKIENEVTIKQLSTEGVTKDTQRTKGKKLTITPGAKTEETSELEMSLLHTAATVQSDSVIPSRPSSQTWTPFVRAKLTHSTRSASGDAIDTKSHVKVMLKMNVTEQTDTVFPNGPTSDTWTPTLKIHTEHSARSVSADATNTKDHLKVRLLFAQCCSLLLFYML